MLFALIMVFAAVVRFAALGSIPPGLWYDEALYALDGYKVSQGHFAWFFDEHGHPREPLFPWLLGSAFALFEPTVLVARCVSALCGTLAVGLMLPVARRFLPPGWALAATAAFAAFRWHIHFSRTIFRAGLASPMALLTVWMFLRWRESRRPLDAALCGAAAGVCLYTYISLRIIPLLLALWAGYMLWRGALRWRRHWRQLALIAGAAILVFMPLGIDYARHPEHFSGRTDEVTMFEENVEVRRADGTVETIRVRKPAGEVFRGLAQNAIDVAGVWLFGGDYVARHGVPYRPIFDPVTGAAFAVGLALTLAALFRSPWRRHGSRHNDAADNPELRAGDSALGPLILLTWFGGFAAASVFSFGAPNILRMQGASPVVILIMVIGLKWLIDRLPGAVSSHVRHTAAGLVLVAFGMLQLNDYFRVFPADLRVRSAFGADYFHAPAKAADDIAPSVDVVYIPQEFLDSLQVRFITIRRDNVKGYAPDEPLPQLDDPGARVAWLTTFHSIANASQAGQDHAAQLTAAPGVIPIRKFAVPIADEYGELQQWWPWAQLWVRGDTDSMP